jgi:hypothetical protein
MPKIDEDIKQAIMAAFESGAVGYSISENSFGECEVTLAPIHFRREIPQPEFDPSEKTYIIIRGDESPKTKERLIAKYNGNAEILPSCTEIRPSGKWTVSLWVNGMCRANGVDDRNVILMYGEPSYEYDDEGEEEE